MNNKKELERAELHSTIWKIANDLRGSVDGWDFKQYVLGLLFYRFISENLTNYINEGEHKAGNKDFDYATLSDEEAEFGRMETLEEKGFYILPSELFQNVRKKSKNNSDLNITLDKIFKNIESSARGTASENDMKGLFDDLDPNSKRLGNTVNERNGKLIKLLDAIGDLKLGDYRENSIDAFGDAYEYLMTMYASNAGKSGGEFFTPQEVGELLAKIAVMGKKEVNRVYDPACGSGSLLLKFAKILGKENIKQGFYGQELNLTTYNLCRINMFLHDINYNNFNISHGDTLINPKHWDFEPFDAIVSNPPYSIRWEGKSNPLLINDPRFSPAGILAPEAKSDLAFTMHMLSWLSEKGTAAIVEYPGVLKRPGAEQKIRKYMIDNNFVDTVIQLPKNLFFGTTIDTCIIVLKKNKTDDSVLFVDASDEYEKSIGNNKLSKENIDNIISMIENRKPIQSKSALIQNSDISIRNYNLYVYNYTRENIIDKDKNINFSSENYNKIVFDQNKVRKQLAEKIEQLEKINKEFFESDTNEFVALGEILDYIQPSKYIVSSTNYKNEYTIPVLTAGKTFLLGYTDEKNNIFHACGEKPTIIFDDFTTSIHWVDFGFKVKSSAIKMLVPKESVSINLKYVYYCMKNIKYKPNDHSRQWIQKYSKFDIPIPHKNIQDKIANDLDELQNLSTELDGLLKQEMEYKKNYVDFLKQGLLTFDGDEYE